MMTPNQINSQRFNTVAKGGYRTVEVDAFLQKVYQHYSRLYSDNNELHERAENMSSLVAEYEKSKSAIAQALIWAQSKADESIEESKKLSASIVAEASQQAESLLVVKRAEAEAYYAERTQAAEDRLKAAEENFEKIKSEAEGFAEKYINDVNNKAKAIIADATEKASSIVASAYADAKSARDKADEIIAQTNKQLEEYKKEIAQLKKELQNFISDANKAADDITVEVDFEFEQKKVTEPEINIQQPEIKDFTFESKALENIEKQTEDKNFEALEEFAEDENNFSDSAESILSEFEEKLPPIDLISQQDDTKQYTPKSSKEEISDVNSYISEIYESVATEKKEKAAKFSIDYKNDLDDLISEVLDGYVSDSDEDQNSDEDLDDFFGGEEEFEY